MRHGKKINHLGRKSQHRKAMLANMSCSLIEHKRINTTIPKAKALRKYVEPLINRSKQDTTHSRRMVFRYLQSKEAVTQLFGEVAQKIADRPGGYTRILRTGHRQGDNAEMCIIELVDYNENLLAAKEATAKPKRKRSRRGKSGAGDTEATATTTATPAKAKTEDKAAEATAAAEATSTEATATPEAEAAATEEAPAAEAPAKEEAPKAEAAAPAEDKPADAPAEDSGDDAAGSEEEKKEGE